MVKKIFSLTLADIICDDIPFNITCLKIAPEDVGCEALFDLFKEFKDKWLPTLVVSLLPSFSPDVKPKSSSVPDNDVQSGSVNILSKEGNSSTAGIAYSVLSN